MATQESDSPLCDLNTFVTAFRGRISPWTLTGWLFLSGSVAGLGSPVGVIVGVIVGAAGLLIAWDRARKRNVQVYLDGLIYRDRKNDEVWKWNEVEEFYVMAEERGLRSASFNSLLNFGASLVFLFIGCSDY